MFSFEHAGQRSRWRTRFSQNVLLPRVAGEGNAEQMGGGERVVRGDNEEIEGESWRLEFEFGDIEVDR